MYTTGQLEGGKGLQATGEADRHGQAQGAAVFVLLARLCGLTKKNGMIVFC